MTVRIGHIGFLNCYPLYHGLEQRGVLAHEKPGGRRGGPDLEFFPGVPTDLNRMLLEGDIDFGPISSIAYARDHRRLLVSRHVSISSLGAVESIQLVARRPLPEIRKVALTRQSATAVALLKTLFKLRFGLQVDYMELEGSVDEALKGCDAVLLIGDEGLTAFHFPRRGATCHDLGALWQEWTGLPMVYAVWATREEFARTNGPELTAAEEELARCMDYGREHLPEVVDAAVGRFPFDRESLARYFALLRYGFPPEYRQGLRRFYELAHRAGELTELPQIRFIDEFTAPRAAEPSAASASAGAGPAATSSQASADGAGAEVTP